MRKSKEEKVQQSVQKMESSSSSHRLHWNHQQMIQIMSSSQSSRMAWDLSCVSWMRERECIRFQSNCKSLEERVSQSRLLEREQFTCLGWRWRMEWISSTLAKNCNSFLKWTFEYLIQNSIKRKWNKFYFIWMTVILLGVK